MKPPNDKSDFSIARGLANILQSLRSRLYILFLVIVLPALMFIITNGIMERRQVIKDFKQQALKTTHQVTETQSDIIDSTRHLLMELATAPALRDPSDPACGNYLSEFLPWVSSYANFGVPLANGDLICNALPLSKPVNVSDRPYIRYALDHKDFSVGTFQQDRATGIPSLNFAYPVFAKDGDEDPVGAIVAVVSLQWWSNRISEIDLPQGSVGYIVDADKRIVASHPPQPGIFGAALLDVGIDSDTISMGESQIIEQADGRRRVFSHSPLFENHNGDVMFMSLGIPIGEGVRAANSHMATQLFGFGGALAVFWLIAVRLLERNVFGPMRVMNRELEQIEGGLATDDEQNNASPKQDSNEYQQVIGGVRQMISDREKAEHDKKSQTELMTALIDTLPDLVFRIDTEARIVEYRTSSKSDLLMSPTEFLGRPLSETLPPDAYAKFMDNFQLQKQTGDLVTWEYQLDFGDNVQDFEARMGGIADSDDVIIVARNISERRGAQRQQEATEARLQRIVSNLPGVVISTDMRDPQNPKRVFISRQLEDLWGYTAAEVLENPSLLTERIDPDDRTEFNEKLIRAAETLEPFRFRYQITSRNGERKWLETHTGASQLTDGHVQTDGFVQDVTAEVEAQQQLEAQRELANRAHKQESIGQLTGGVAHDFNNLLAVIMGNLELLRDELDNDEQLGLVDASIGATKRGADLTRNMLAFARKARLDPEVIDLNRLVNETRIWAGRTLPATIGIETSLLAGLWKIKTDPSSTESAFLNLLLNARDAMSDGGKLTIETANVRIDEAYVESRQEDLEPGRYVMLAVSDSGHGIPAEELDRIFEPFYSTKGPGAGSGLGLSMIEGFMRQSGGAVRVYSEEGVGTTFKLYFRAMENPQEDNPKRPEIVEPATLQGQRILVAEDEPDVLQVIVTTLEKAGYVATPATSGDEARAIFEADPTFDLLLTDIVMPGELQGTTLSRALRENYPELRVVFMSGYAREATVHGNGLRPEDIRVMKPVSRNDLLTAVRKALS